MKTLFRIAGIHLALSGAGVAFASNGGEAARAIMSVETGTQLDGKEAYLKARCDRCHAIASQEIDATTNSERMLGPDLGEMSAERSVDWIVRYVKKEVDIDDKTHRFTFKGTDEDLQTIAEWLVGLRPRP